MGFTLSSLRLCVVCILHVSLIINFIQLGYSALMYAALFGKTKFVVELVKAGANLNLQNEVCQYILYMMHLKKTY